MVTDDQLAGFEVSPQQRRQWLLQHNIPSATVRIVVELKGNLDVAALRRAVASTVSRHEILRTTFHIFPGRTVPVQVIHEALPPLWRLINNEPGTSDFGHESISTVLDEDKSCGFDYENGPLVRITLIRLQSQVHLMTICVSSMCADRESLLLIIREIAAFYVGDGAENEPMQYADLAHWQNQIIENETVGQAGRDFWKQDEVAMPTAILPFERLPMGPEMLQHAHAELELDSEVVKSLHHAATNASLSESSLLASCWQALISRMSGMNDVRVFHASDGRSYDDLLLAVGPLSRWLPIQVGFESSTTIDRLWRRTFKSTQDAARWEQYWNPDTPSLDGYCTHGLANRIGFEFEELTDQIRAGEIEVTLRSRTSTTEPFKLQLSCLTTSDGVTLKFSYDTRRYTPADIQHLADYYVALLHSALRHPLEHIGALNMLSDTQRHTMLLEWNSTNQDFPAHKAVHELFEDAARRTPEAIALVFENDQLTYGELNARANQLAHRLIHDGAVADARVGLYLTRSVDLIVGLLGILKAGAAYMPLDPALPRERLEWMLEDSGARLVVSHSALPPLTTDCVKVVFVDGDAENLANQSPHNPHPVVTPNHLVYVIYTSGSTGRPKGVAVEHGNLLNYVHGIVQRLDLPVGAGYASVSTIAADLGNTTVFAALCSGGCLHLISHERAIDPGLWRAYWRSHSIDCLKIVPSHLDALLGGDKVSPDMLPRKVLVLGGESSSWELISRIFERAPSLRVINHYGPTETTVGVLTYEIATSQKANEVASQSVPLGKPLPNSKAYVLNEYLQAAAIGEIGELYIGGAGVGREYLNQGELSARKFVKDPFSTEPGARIYRTGDMALYLPDGKHHSIQGAYR